MATLKNLTIDDTGFLKFPTGTTGERPSASPGMFRFNSTTGRIENYVNSAWQNMISGKLGDWAYKEGPVSFNADFKANWNNGQSQGDSLDAATYGYGILVKETGQYYALGYQRVGDTQYGGLSLNGNRTSLESRSDALWGHDHAGTGGQWSMSFYLGYMEANWIISWGPATNYASGVAYGTLGYNGGLYILRMS